MCVTDLCPVGALTTRDFRFKTRVWLLSSTDSICTGCSRGCNVFMESHQGEVKRYRPRFQPEVNEYWMCDEGRLSYKEIHLGRSTELRVDGQKELLWPRTARALAPRLRDAAARGGMAFVASMQASSESLLAARTFVEGQLPGASVYVSGQADGPSDAFLIQADKNPNRAGVAMVFGQDALRNTAYKLLEDIEAGRVRSLYMMRADLPFDQAGRARFAAALRKLDLFVLQAPHELELGELAHVFLPSATHAEQEGTWVNEAGIPQRVGAAIAPVGQALPDWEIFGRLTRGADAEAPDFDTLHERFAASLAAQ